MIARETDRGRHCALADGASKQHFKISTGLKDLIGRDLITDDFVAIFELVKNSFDAHASSVHLYFGDDRIVIADDGKGMSRRDILEKWLFVAYSAKRLGTEDENYRDKIGDRRRPFAGAKGVGRFSCDRLGEELRLSTLATGQPTQILEIDWRLYEHNPKEEFADIFVDLAESDTFPELPIPPPKNTGTVLDIRGLRSVWDRPKLLELKRALSKLIDPFSQGESGFNIEITAPSQLADDQEAEAHNRRISENQAAKPTVNGIIENPILDVLRSRTTVVRVSLVDGDSKLETTLEDRGELIYRIREPNLYRGLSGTNFSADIYYLNRGAKVVFNNRMGLPSIQFGSVFLFRNGFRVFPVGEDWNDFFGLNRRKQQGQRRFLGGRDLIGRVDINGVPGFDESTSRNQGLIHNEKVQDLIDCVRDKCVRRLERYVVDITWKDKFDKDTSDISRMRIDESSSLIAQLVSRLASAEGVELLDYNPDLVRIVDEKSSAFEDSLKALELLADKTGDASLVARVNDAKARIKALQKAEADAREAERRAEERATIAESAAISAESRLVEERQRSQFLVSAASLDQDTILNLHHQIIIHASDVHHDVQRMMAKIRTGTAVPAEELSDFLGRISYRNSQILTAAKFATKGGYKQQSSEVEADLVVYIRDYIENVASLWAPRGVSIHVDTSNVSFKRRFKPIEISIVIDNLISNAAKARATNIEFATALIKGANPALEIIVADDGPGWPKKIKPLSDVFSKGVTTTNGSGLGLYHVKQVVEGLGGEIEALAEPYSDELDGAAIRIRLPA